MRFTGKFIMPPDAMLQSAVDLGEEFLHSSGAGAGDVAVSRRNSRSPSKLVDASAAQFLRFFERPATIAGAVARYSRAANLEPGAVLEDALPLLRSLMGEGLLVRADSLDALLIAEPLAVGNEIGEWTIFRCVQALSDTEVYQVRDTAGRWGALKMCRPGDRRSEQALQHEAGILGSIEASSLPDLVTTGEWQGRRFLVTAWISGIDAQTASGEARGESGNADRAALLKLGGEVLAAYAALHRQELLHGDVHPDNLLVERDGRVKILDFGLAVVAGGERPGRGGVAFFFEPEYAQALLAGDAAPSATPAGEQYAIAALLYLLVTGRHTKDFSLERTGMLGQIASGGSDDFAKRGSAAWPEVEKILRQALSKEPSDRFASLEEFYDAWSRVRFSLEEQAASAAPAGAKLREIAATVLRESANQGRWMREGFQAAPRVTMNSGYAGLAYALYRIACSRDDGELLATADLWATRAVREIESEQAFEERDLGANRPKIALASLHHQRAGVYAADALIAAARCDSDGFERAIRRFVAWGVHALEEQTPSLDLTLGLAGNLLGCSLLVDNVRQAGRMLGHKEEFDQLAALGKELYSRLWAALADAPPIGDGHGLRDTGMAHGWAGFLYASLCWRGSLKGEGPTAVLERLDQLAGCAAPQGRGLSWAPAGRGAVPGWCNGSAGLVFLWSAAFAASGRGRYLELAEGAAWHTWETPSADFSLCCGLAGQAYALLNFHRYSGEAAWLGRARSMASWAADAADSLQPGAAAPEVRPESLYHGLAGIAVLAEDVERPLEARMPFFERV